jgi:hypothetical protein
MKTAVVLRACNKLALSVVFFLALSSTSRSAFGADFPLGPNAQMTPGELCQHPDSYRYPEHIPYCTRDVANELKAQIIAAYDQQFGFHIQSMDRQLFKIDHYIPLCAGGGNDLSNLWPQHVSVYTITDPLEPLVCGKMAQGRLTQKDAVAYIRAAKTNLSQAPAVIAHVNSL